METKPVQLFLQSLLQVKNKNPPPRPSKKKIIKRTGPKQRRKSISFAQRRQIIAKLLCGESTVQQVLFDEGIHPSILYKYKKNPIRWVDGKAKKQDLSLVDRAKLTIIAFFFLISFGVGKLLV